MRVSIKVGDTYSTNNYGDLVIVEYFNHKRVKVRFKDTGSELFAAAGHIKEGHVKDPIKPSVYGVGFIGVGLYKAKIQGKMTKSYKAWTAMLQRCYDKKAKSYERYALLGVSVHDDWLNFQNFAEFYDRNFREGFQLDKDLRMYGSNIYSSQTCCYVPREINTLLTASNFTRGIYPVGVCYDKATKKYRTQISINNIRNRLGYFITPEQAFEAYKVAKESNVKKVAQEHYDLGNIPKDVYENLMNWVAIPFPE